jgi:hypothetical protein
MVDAAAISAARDTVQVNRYRQTDSFVGNDPPAALRSRPLVD